MSSKISFGASILWPAPDVIGVDAGDKRDHVVIPIIGGFVTPV